jgi:hypothetical protein
MKIYIAFYILLLLIGIWNLTIAILGLFPRFRATTVGTLIHTNTRRIIRVRRGKIPIRTCYVYAYRVNGKEYRYKADQYRSKQNLHRKASMVYVKWFPRHVYPNKFTGEMEWPVGICLIILSTVYLYAIISAPGI